MSGLQEAFARIAKFRAELAEKQQLVLEHLYYTYKYSNLEQQIPVLTTALQVAADSGEGALKILSEKTTEVLNFVIEPELAEALEKYIELSQGKSGLNLVTDPGLDLNYMNDIPNAHEYNAIEWIDYLAMGQRASQYHKFAVDNNKSAYSQLKDPDLQKLKLVLAEICRDPDLTTEITNSNAYITLCGVSLVSSD